MRKTKIVCTLGPNENDYELMKKLAEKMDVARFNFSHGSHQEHLGRLASRHVRTPVVRSQRCWTRRDRRFVQVSSRTTRR